MIKAKQNENNNNITKKCSAKAFKCLWTVLRPQIVIVNHFFNAFYTANCDELAIIVSDNFV